MNSKWMERGYQAGCYIVVDAVTWCSWLHVFGWIDLPQNI